MPVLRLKANLGQGCSGHALGRKFQRALEIIVLVELYYFSPSFGNLCFFTIVVDWCLGFSAEFDVYLLLLLYICSQYWDVDASYCNICMFQVPTERSFPQAECPHARLGKATYNEFNFAINYQYVPSK